MMIMWLDFNRCAMFEKHLSRTLNASVLSMHYIPRIISLIFFLNTPVLKIVRPSIGSSCVVDEAMIPSKVMCVFHRDLSSKNAEKRGAATCLQSRLGELLDIEKR
jgi:hypothetical protein